MGYGIPDFASGAFNDPRRREELRLEIEDTIRRFEPRFLSVRVHLVDARDRLETTLRLRIDAVLHADPAPEAVTFDTVVDPTTDDVLVRRKTDGRAVTASWHRPGRCDWMQPRRMAQRPARGVRVSGSAPSVRPRPQPPSGGGGLLSRCIHSRRPPSATNAR